MITACWESNILLVLAVFFSCFNSSQDQESRAGKQQREWNKMTDDDKMLLYIYVVSVLIKILKTSLNCPLNTFIYFTYISFHTLCLLPTTTWCRSFLFIYLLRRKISRFWRETLTMMTETEMTKIMLPFTNWRIMNSKFQVTQKNIMTCALIELFQFTSINLKV